MTDPSDPSADEIDRIDPPQGRTITRAAFSADPAAAIRAADAGPVTVVGDEGPVMVLSTMEMGDE